jgi:hypothetical protein
MSDERKDDTPPSNEAKPKRRMPRVSAGMAMGIGSAAIVAALLYANRNRRSDRENKD